MQFGDFTKAYQLKSDEELLQLAGDSENLTLPARLALEGELTRRRVKLDRHSQPVTIESTTLLVSKIVPTENHEYRIGEFIEQVLRTYHSRFWLFFRITLPAVTIGTFAVILSRNHVREVTSHLPRGIDLLSHRTEILEIWITNLTAYFISWLAFCAAFGAICSVVQQIGAGMVPSVGQSLSCVRSRLSAFLRLSFLLFFLALVAEAAALLITTGLFWSLHRWQIHANRFIIYGSSYCITGLAFLVLSRFALAMPSVVLDNYGVGPAMFRSDELTEHNWLTLAVLLAKALIGGYIAGMLPFWLASSLLRDVQLPSFFPWLLTIASVIGVTAVEPTMFVGFAMLYLGQSIRKTPEKNVTQSLLVSTY